MSDNESPQKQPEQPGCAPVPCSAVVVTRYPSGCLGLDYCGAQFWWWCFKLEDMLGKLGELGVEICKVRWQERYYDGDYRNPENYKTRPWIPRNATAKQPPET